MRQRSILTIAVLAVVAACAGFLLRAVDAGNSSARASTKEPATVHAVAQSESALTATARAVPIVNRVPTLSTQPESAAALAAALSVAIGSLLLLHQARCLVGPARRRRAPPFLVG
jgi:hypothetical protein